MKALMTSDAEWENVAERCYVSRRDFPFVEPGSLGEGMVWLGSIDRCPADQSGDAGTEAGVRPRPGQGKGMTLSMP